MALDEVHGRLQMLVIAVELLRRIMEPHIHYGCVLLKGVQHAHLQQHLQRVEELQPRVGPHLRR